MANFEEIGQGVLDPVENQGYCVDISICLDGTGSMSPIIDEVKDNALAFCDKFHKAMEANGKNVDQLRVKVIPFRDYTYDGAKAMDDSGFFSLPEQNKEFRAYVSGITAEGGGDAPESALEAMALAMRSQWTKSGSKRRHVILMFTDASAVPLQDPKRTASEYYPADMPANLAQLGDMWSGYSQEMEGMPEGRAARMVLFVPNEQPWSDMQVWNNVWTSFSKAGKGLEEVDIDLAINLLVNSVA